MSKSVEYQRNGKLLNYFTLLCLLQLDFDIFLIKEVEILYKDRNTCVFQYGIDLYIKKELTPTSCSLLATTHTFLHFIRRDVSQFQLTQT